MNYYKILEVCPTATQKEIKQSYRQLAKQFHPDSQNQSANHDSIVEINKAYEVLGDTQRRNHYDQQLTVTEKHNLSKREQRQTQAHYQYHHQKERETEQSFDKWIKTIYLPLNRLFSNIINPLPHQIDLLAADPFDDELVANFEKYLANCCQLLEKARLIFSSQPNPTEVAKVALSLYYCLNHLDDGLEELGQFTCCYDEHYLYTGKELFQLAKQVLQEAKVIA